MLLGFFGVYSPVGPSKVGCFTASFAGRYSLVISDVKRSVQYEISIEIIQAARLYLLLFGSLAGQTFQECLARETIALWPINLILGWGGDV